ncbi:16S rRNA (adenine(1518)-N(6)/adenine(1519)-N(6))-dimethyltransferase RsmA [Azohydromonas sediminis]|uniref:16S rRNA (adenine(1518)-N(6)/adenine(1519)-N(6))- dimethyltransferase RsmA n=1 Tax=Azohydromonas sediminis TaxID=2259674 RepID=UPI000E64913D|nr:16S rRNA (adenine(1518)-N(6)/adenine(1519)-N(6))-dimethyltransferase RsmA [Azohydromonas sediminis]
MKHIARKRFGQHFLVDAGVIDAIVAAVDPRPGDALVEIGPGLGALTAPLLARCGALTVIELDRDLAARLRQRSGLDVVEADVLTVDFAALAHERGQPLRIVGNLPYNISTPILFHLLDAAAHWRDAHFMLQKEVVARMAAAPGGKDYGRLTVMLQWRCAVEPLFDVPPQAFEPPPRVDSAVVRLRPHVPPPAVDAERLGALVTVAFSQRRKLLRHTLGRWLDAQRFAAAFDLQRRAEEVPVAEYVALAAALPR